MTSFSAAINADDQSLFVILVGGCGEFGMNVTCYVYKKQLYIVDCGSKFAGERLLGVDCIIPLLDDLITSFGGVAAYLVTHGHEDHIGALPFLYRKWPAKIYASAWTNDLIKEKFLKTKINCANDSLVVVEAGDTTFSNDFSVEWVHINHSIPMACALLISTPLDRVFHTGDFRLDPCRTHEIGTDLNQLKTIGDKSISLLVADSTNAESEQRAFFEEEVAGALETLISAAQGRVLFSTFTSNIGRIRSFVNICVKLNKRIVVIGRGMERSIERAASFGLLRIPTATLVKEEDIASCEDSSLAALTTGSQGEYLSALSRIVNDEHPHWLLRAQDTIVMSSRIIPGNELAVSQLISLCHRKGVHVITSKNTPTINASGHATRDDLATLIDIIKPTYYLPVHGTFSQLKANEDICKTLSRHHPQAIKGENGNIFRINRQHIDSIGTISISRLFVDSFSQQPLEYDTLKERLKIGDLGLIVITGVVNKTNNCWLVKPKLEFRGLQFATKNAPLQIEQDLTASLTKIVDQHHDEVSFNEIAKNHTRKQCSLIIHKKPVVISKIHFII